MKRKCARLLFNGYVDVTSLLCLHVFKKIIGPEVKLKSLFTFLINFLYTLSFFSFPKLNLC